MNDNSKKPENWTVDHEKILIEWADKAMCFRWLHSKSHGMYHKRNTWYTIPVIIISTLTGTANFAQERVPVEHRNLFAMVVGGFNILAGLITTIQQFLKITQLNEAHRVSSISWDKFYRNIKVELSRNHAERTEVSHMIKMSKEEYDRLMETSPIIPEEILKDFKNTLKKQDKEKDKNNELLDDKIKHPIIKPEICDELISTADACNPHTRQLCSDPAQDKLIETNIAIDRFILEFDKQNNRDPTPNEILDNLNKKHNKALLTKSISSRIQSLELTNYNDDNIESL